jgi:hypothetical protein
MISTATILRSISAHSQHRETLQRAAADCEALERIRAIVDQALADRQAQPYDAMGEAPSIKLSKLIEAIKGAGQ